MLISTLPGFELTTDGRIVYTGPRFDNCAAGAYPVIVPFQFVDNAAAVPQPKFPSPANNAVAQGW
jgi:hypothetical protein